MLSSHVKYHCCHGYIINHAFHSKQLFQWSPLVFRVEKIFHLFAALTCEISCLSTLKEKFCIMISVQPCNILYISRTHRVWSCRNTNYLFWKKQVKAAALLIHKQLSSSVPNSIRLHQIFKIWPNERTSRWPECGYGHLMGVATQRLNLQCPLLHFLFILRLWLLVQKREAAFKWKFNCDFNVTLTVVEDQ